MDIEKFWNEGMEHKTYKLYCPPFDDKPTYVGPYGESIIETPTPEQLAHLKKMDGGRGAGRQKGKMLSLAYNSRPGKDADGNDITFHFKDQDGSSK